MAIRRAAEAIPRFIDHERPWPRAPDFSDPDLQQIMDEATRPQSVTIITYGMPGSGKTSIVSSIVNEDMGTNDGWDPVTRTANRVRIQVDQVSVNVVDTPGISADSPPNNQDKETTKLVGSIATNECKGLVIICLEMYARVYASTLKPLAAIYQQFGRYFFTHVIVALTKADLYDEDKWLKLPRHGMNKKKFLQSKLAEEVENRKTTLKRHFTATADQALPGCHIGMTEEEFDELQIPVIPTSRLNKKNMDRMKQVAHDYWFDLLLIKSCQKLQGSGLIKIHEERLSKLPTELVRQEVGEEVFERLRENSSMLNLATVLRMIRFYNWCQECQYHKNVTTLTRFDQVEATGED